MSTVILTEKKRICIFVNALISCIACVMLATALSTALPPIIREFHVSATTGQWLTSGYSLVMGITTPLTAFLLTRFPTKRLYCVANIIFIAGLLICIFSTNFSIMMTGRVLQAASAGILLSLTQVITLTIFPDDQKGTAMGWYGLAFAVAPLVAPTAAGFAVDAVGWKMVFIFPLIVMTISLVCAMFVFENVLDNTKKKFDVCSFILSALAFGGVTLGIGNIGNYGITGTRTILPLLIGIVGAALFAHRQLHLTEPFLELRILANRDYAVSVLGSMLLYFISLGASIVLPLYVQQTLGLPTTISALMMLPGAIASALISPYAGRIYDKIGIRLLFRTGAVGLIVSNAAMCFVTLRTPVWVAAILYVVRNCAITCLMMPLVTWGASSVPKEMTAHATALLNSLRTISGAIGSAVFVAVMTFVADNSIATYGQNASIHGVNMTFLAMAASSVLLLLLAILGTKRSS